MPYVILIKNHSTGKQGLSDPYVTKNAMLKDKRKIENKIERNGYSHITVHERKIK